MPSMKRQKIVIAFILFTLLLSLIFTLTYGNLTHHQSAATLSNLQTPTAPSFQVQVLSPLDNYTYGSYNGPENITAEQAAHTTTYNLILPLNITANQEISRITYSLDGSDNRTFDQNTAASLTLSYGVHNLTAYATNLKGIVCKSNLTFTVGYGYPFINKITVGQIQEFTSYFESRGLKVQAENTDESKWQNIWSLLYAGSVSVVSKDNFADAVIANGIDIIWFTQDSNNVTWYAKYYGNSWLPTIYEYSATLV